MGGGEVNEWLPELVVRVAGAAEVGDPPVLVALVAEEPDGSGFGLEFQLASVFSDQDRRMGMDTYCVCTSEGATHYGGVKRLQADSEGVVLAFERAAAERLHIPDHFRIRLDVAAEDKASFVDAIRRVLGASEDR